MPKRIFFITATLLFMAPVFIQVNRPSPVYAQRVQDIQGWNNTRWGMSYEEVRSIYPVENLRQMSQTSAFSHSASLEGYRLGRSYYKVMFYFNSNQLESVVLEWWPHRFGDQNGESPLDDLLSGLRGRYGEPIDDSYDNINIWVRKWYLPSTTIQVNVLGEDRTLRQCYDTSNCPFLRDYRLTVVYRQQGIMEGL